MIDKIKLICNYKNIPSQGITINSHQINYLDFNISNTKEYVSNVKIANRGLAIDALIEGKEEEYKNREMVDPNSFPEIGLLSLKSININTSKLIGLDLIYNELISKIDTLTSSKMGLINGTDYSKLDLTDATMLSNNLNIDFNTKERKLISRLIIMSNSIAMDSRIGPAKTVLVGSNVRSFLLEMSDSILNSTIIKHDPPTDLYLCPGELAECLIGTISQMDIIHSDKIDRNKVILMRHDNEFRAGVNLLISDDNYCIFDIPGWENTIRWFDFIF